MDTILIMKVRVADMSSRMIHLAISKKICEELNLHVGKFNFGNLLPDLYQEDKGKDSSHYRIKKETYEESKSDRYQYYDFDRFFSNYSDKINNEIYLGYYCHLITDEMWIQKIYIKYMRDKDRKKKYDLQKYYYDDYLKINHWVKQKYNLKNIIEIDSYEIEYVDKEKNCNLLELLKKDFSVEDVDSDLLILDLDEIYKFIDETSAGIVEKIKGFGL